MELSFPVHEHTEISQKPRTSRIACMSFLENLGNLVSHACIS